MPVSPDSLGRFFSALLRERYATNPEPPQAYEEWRLSGALLFVDSVGFTPMVEELVARGPYGVEHATEILNESISPLVRGVAAAGGDVIDFAGDAILAVWLVAPGEASLALAIARAAGFALDTLKDATRAKRLRLRCSLGAGELVAHLVGGHGGRWHFAVSGAPFEQVRLADAMASPSELVTSPEVHAIAGAALSGDEFAGGAFRVRAAKASPPSGGAPRELRAAVAAYAAHLPKAVTERIDRIEERWLAELRRATVIFVRLPGLADRGRLGGPRAHDVVGAVQRIVGELGGEILQFVVDDKGPVLVVVFGLPPHVHEDDPARAVAASRRIVDALQSRSVTCGVGIATGRVYCGILGTEERSEYTLVGETMNLAARLMQRAEPGPLCDTRTRELTEGRAEFAVEGSLRVKGVDSEVAIHRVASVSLEAETREVESERSPGLVDRAHEVTLLLGRLEMLRRERRGGTLALVGEAGIGKSRLVRELVMQAEAAGVGSLLAPGAALDSTPHARWRPALQKLLRLEARTTEDPDFEFLGEFLGVTAGSTKSVDDEERAHRTRDALARTLADAARAAPLVLCVEDAHWMDSLSWSIVARLAESSPEILLVMTSRDLEGTAPADALARLERAGLARVPLEPLPVEERVILAGRTIGVSALPPTMASWIAQRSGGNPLFCRELALAAVENETVRVVDGQAEVLTDPGAPAAVGLPETLQGVITSRVDRLESREQVTLRIASVLGAKFTEEALLAIHDAPAEATRVDLARLVERGFLDEDPDVATRFSFHHVLLREAVYDSLPYRRRRELHAALARWMETRFATDLPAHAAALADHWERAEEWRLAFAALVRAGEMALRSFANREAVRHFAGAVTIRSRVPELRLQAEAWSPELGLARAYHRMGDEGGSRRAIEDALRAAGEVLPRRTIARVVAIIREAAHRMLPAAIRERPPRGPLGSPARLRDAVRAYDSLPEILYYENDPLAMTIAILRFARLAEGESQPSAEQARALGWIGILHSILGRRRALERAFDQALAVAADSGDAAVDAWLRLARGSALAQFGAWSDAERWIRESRDRCAAMGDRTRWWNVMSALGHVLSYRGELASGAEVLGEALAANRDTDNPLFLCWGLAGRADVLHRLGRPRDATEVIRLLRSARTAHEQRPDRAADLFSRGLLAAALWRNGDTGEAFDLARDTIEHALEGVPIVWIQVSSFLGLTEVLGEASREPALHEEAVALLASLERAVGGFARLIPVGVPAHRLVRGTLDIARGRTRRARRVLASGVEAARRLAMPTELGRLHLAVAETLPPDAARVEIEQAIEAFTRIDARFALRVALERLGR